MWGRARGINRVATGSLCGTASHKAEAPRSNGKPLGNSTPQSWKQRGKPLGKSQPQSGKQREASEEQQATERGATGSNGKLLRSSKPQNRKQQEASEEQQVIENTVFYQ